MKEKLKRHAVLIEIAGIVVLSGAYAANVFWFVQNQHDRSVAKITQYTHVAQQVNRLEKDLLINQTALRTHQQTYRQHQRQSNDARCRSGAYPELTKLAKQHRVRLEKMVHQPEYGAAEQAQDKTAIGAGQQVDVVFELRGRWKDYMQFRKALTQSACWVRTVAEQVQATGTATEIQSRLTLSVLQLSVPEQGEYPGHDV